MKDGVERSYYDGGKVSSECTYVNGLPNGITRHWHENGVLEAEIPVKNGVPEGIVKHWNDKGELLGTYEIRNGTGTRKMWHPSGKLMGELPMLNGKFTGRQRVWGEDGTLITEQYWIENKKVSKKKYLEACKTNPNFPVYDDSGSPPNRFRPPRKKKKNMNRESANNPLINKLLTTTRAQEVLSWLKTPNVPTRTLGELPTTEASIELAEESYAAGAAEVTAVDIHTYEDGQENTGKLVIRLPEDPEKREKVFDWCGERAQEQGYDPEEDTGQTHLFVMLD